MFCGGFCGSGLVLSPRRSSRHAAWDCIKCVRVNDAASDWRPLNPSSADLMCPRGHLGLATTPINRFNRQRRSNRPAWSDMALPRLFTALARSHRIPWSVRWLVVIGILGMGLSKGRGAAAQNAAEDHPFPKRVTAPPLDGGQEWINTTRPLTLADLRGKFVLIDFWTFCCINCMHVLPELQKLEHAYPNELVVVGVHSAKFAGEQDAGNIREAVQRYEVEHPVVNDAEHKIW